MILVLTRFFLSECAFQQFAHNFCKNAAVIRLPRGLISRNFARAARAGQIAQKNLRKSQQSLDPGHGGGDRDVARLRGLGVGSGTSSASECALGQRA